MRSIKPLTSLLIVHLVPMCPATHKCLRAAAEKERPGWRRA
jgi:hypothetical protein